MVSWLSYLSTGNLYICKEGLYSERGLWHLLECLQSVSIRAAYKACHSDVSWVAWHLAGLFNSLLQWLVDSPTKVVMGNVLSCHLLSQYGCMLTAYPLPIRWKRRCPCTKYRSLRIFVITYHIAENKGIITAGNRTHSNLTKGTPDLVLSGSPWESNVNILEKKIPCHNIVWGSNQVNKVSNIIEDVQAPCVARLAAAMGLTKM